MKQFTKVAFAALLSVAAFTGCQNEIAAPDSANNKVHFILHAGSPDTKTGIEFNNNGSYTPYWNNGDQIGILFTLPSSDTDLHNDAVFANTKASGSEATFEGDVTIGDGEGITFYSYYPASAGKKKYKDGTIGLDIPSAQSPVKNGTKGYSFDPAADLLIAKPSTCIAVSGEAANEVDMYFARLSALARIELNAASGATIAGEAVKSIKFETSSGDIAGRVVVNPETGEYSKTNSLNGSKSITASYDVAACPVLIGAANENNVFLSVAPISIPAGSSLTFTIKTVNVSTGADAHTLVKTISSLPNEIAFESSKPTVIKLTLSDDNIENNTVVYSLVKDASALTIGSEVIIAAASYDRALGTTQNSNNRAAVDIEKVGETIAPGEAVQVLTIVAGSIANTLALSTGEGYLAAASSNSNYLRTVADLSGDSSWSIDIDGGSGVATVQAQGNYTRNILKYNNGSSIFSCYASGQQDIAIYKRSTEDNRTSVSLSFSPSDPADITFGDSFTEPTLTVNPSEAPVAYTVETVPANIATINASTGKLTITAAGTITVTATVSDVTTYKPASASYTLTVVDPSVVDYVTLPWAYPDGEDSATSAGIQAIDGVTASGLGSDYAAANAPYLIKLDGTGDYFIIKTDSSIGQVSVKYKMIGGASTSSLSFSESSDGDTFTEVQSLSISGDQNSTGVLTTTDAFDAGSRYVKIVFTKGSNVGIGGISITDAASASITWNLASIAITTAPTKTVYTAGESFDPAGMVVTAHYVDADDATNTKDEAVTGYTITPDGALAVSDTQVTISYQSKTATQNITVNAAPAGNDGSLEHPYTASEARALALNGDTGSYYISGIVTKIQNQYSASYGTANFWIDENGTDQTVFEGYKIKYFGNVNWVEGNAEIALNDEVIIYGTLTVYNTTTAETSSGYLVSLNGKTKGLTLAAPTVTTNDSSKQITVAWTAATGTESSISYVINCGTQSYNATAAGSHTFTMAAYGHFDISVVASSDDAISATAVTSATLSDPSSTTKDYYKLVTSISDVTAGTYVVGALRSTSATNNFYFAKASVSSGDWVVSDEAITVAESNGVRKFEIANLPSGAVEFTLTGDNTNGFTISHGSDYLYYTAASNRKLAFAASGSSQKWTVSAKSSPLISGGVVLKAVGTQNYTISENSTGTGAIRGYANTTEYRAIYLFKKVNE